MASNQDLKLVCQRLAAKDFETILEAEQALERFEQLTTPEVVLGLIAAAEHSIQSEVCR